MIGTLLKVLAAPFVDRVAGLAELYVKKQISADELKAKIQEATVETFAEVEKAWADVAARQYAGFQQTVRSSPVVARAYAAVIVTQLFVLLWYQWGASAFLLVTGQAWPSAGATVDWAYALLALCLGGGALVFRRTEIPG